NHLMTPEISVSAASFPSSGFKVSSLAAYRPCEEALSPIPTHLPCNHPIDSYVQDNTSYLHLSKYHVPIFNTSRGATPARHAFARLSRAVSRAISGSTQNKGARSDALSAHNGPRQRSRPVARFLLQPVR